MSITKYKVGAFGAFIDVVQVERESTQSVWIKGWTFDAGPGTGVPRKHAKRSAYDNYFDTWDEAKAFLVARAEAAVLNARAELAAANDTLGNAKGLKRPEAVA